MKSSADLTKHKLLQYLLLFGIDTVTAEVYLTLSKNGPQTALQLSRSTNYSRTQVYRFLESLEELQLVSVTNFTHGSLYEALPYTNLEQVILAKQSETSELQSSLSQMSNLFLKFPQVSEAKQAKIVHYKGIAGLKQVNWNLTKADKEYRVFEVSHLSNYLDKAFATRCRQRVIDRKIKTYDLMNEPTTPLADLEPFDPKLSQIRYADPKILSINFEMYIYNDVVTLLDYQNDDILCVEIYHPALKQMQQQLFDAIWAQSDPVKLV